MSKKINEQKIKKLKQEAEQLAYEVNQLQEEMAATLNLFSDTVDPELVDYYTYYYKAAEIKHSYLLKRLKKVYYEDKSSHVI